MSRVREVLDFLTRNGFGKAASALLEDVVERGVEVNDYSVHDPVLPPVKTGVDRVESAGTGGGGGGGEEEEGLEAGGSPILDSSLSSDEFVSLRCSPAEDLIELNNPFGQWHTMAAEADDSSSGFSEFGTARDYTFPNIFSDSNWYDEKFGGCSRDPYLMRSSCSSKDEFLNNIQADHQHQKKSDPYFHSEMNICCLNRPEGESGAACEDCTKMYGSSDSHCEVKVCYDSSVGVGSSDSSTHKNSFISHKGDLSDHSYKKSAEKIEDIWSQPKEKELYIHASGSIHDDNVQNPKSHCLEGDFFDFSIQDLKSSSEEKRMKPSLSEKDLHMLSGPSINKSVPADNGQKFDHKEGKLPDHLEKGCLVTGINGANAHSSPFLHYNSENPLQSDLTHAHTLDAREEVPSDHQDQQITVEAKEDFGSNRFFGHEANSDEYEIFELRIVHRKNRTGFEENKDFPIVMNSVIAGRYYVTEYLGSAAFSKVIQAHDLQTGMDLCLKIIKNDKDFFDQSLDEIKLLKFVNKHDPNDECHILRLFDYFYHQEHLFIVCELLKANLYEFQKYNQESGGEIYYTLSRIQRIAQQCLKALEYLHRLGIIHCDLKPENILIKSYSRCEIKIIDLGSSCFQTDNLCFYVQSRSYRAPEVILGVPYDQKIDIWSLGCILAELFCGEVLFPNDSVAMLLARVTGVLGPFDTEMLLKGQERHKYFTDSFEIYHKNEETEQVEYIVPQKTSLARQLDYPDPVFVDFLSCLLQTNPQTRPTAADALQHPWLFHTYQ